VHLQGERRSSTLSSTVTTNNTDCESTAFDYLLGAAGPPPDWNTTQESFPSRFWSSSKANTYYPMGGVYHSTPVVASPPSALLRDDSYQAFVKSYTQNYTTNVNGQAEPRHTVLYTQTIDGLLHAFGVEYDPTKVDTYKFVGSTHDSTGYLNEMWAFIPPAVMPSLLSSGSFAASSTILTDGAPVVKDTVYQRTNVGTGSDWHTTLVTGIGSPFGGGVVPGYYAMDVTDPNFANRGSSGTVFNSSHKSTGNTGTPAYMTTAGLPQGPHFLWQLTFHSNVTDEPASSSGSLASGTNDSSNLFAAYSGTPAITTLYFTDPDANSSTPMEVGVAILPGGAAAATGSSTGSCKRLGCNGATTGAKCADASPGGTGGEGTTSSFGLSTYVRQWGTSCTAAVAGRTISIVRLDNGEVIRTFGQLNDFPNITNTTSTARLPIASANGGSTVATSGSTAALFTQYGRFTSADFDSPISGTPVPYPADVGTDAKKVFFGDQDGTVWVLDVSDTNPNNWFVQPFLDSFNEDARGAYTGAPSEAAWALKRAPLAGAPIVTAGRDGHLNLNFATGDNSVIGQTSTPNYAYSVGYEPQSGTGFSATSPLAASVNWYMLLPNSTGEMVTGQQTVFDGVYYFATYAPPSSASACGGGSAYLWGMDFQRPASSSDPTVLSSTTGTPYGGIAEIRDPSASSTASLVQDFAVKDSAGNAVNAIIPGVAITATAACAQTSPITDPVTGGQAMSLSNVQPSTYQLTATIGAKSSSVSGGGSANVAVSQQTLANGVRTTTLVDSWASIVE
jgi:type IV pilus assembly protein PilY1